MIVTTTQSVEGRQIVDYLGIVTGVGLMGGHRCFTKLAWYRVAASETILCRAWQRNSDFSCDCSAEYIM